MRGGELKRPQRLELVQRRKNLHESKKRNALKRLKISISGAMLNGLT